jgi:hypothetical protein
MTLEGGNSNHQPIAASLPVTGITESRKSKGESLTIGRWKKMYAK